MSGDIKLTRPQRVETLRPGDHCRMAADVLNVDKIMFKKGTECLIICTNGNNRFFTLEQEIKGKRQVVEVRVEMIEVIPAKT